MEIFKELQSEKTRITQTDGNQSKNGCNTCNHAATIVSVAQQADTDEALSGTNEGSKDKDVVGTRKPPSDSDKEITIEQEYWEQTNFKHRLKGKSNMNNIRRLTLKEHSIIETNKSACVDPSKYKLDRATTQVLQMLQELKYVGSYHNILSKGKSSVVIYAEFAGSPIARYSYYSYGNAVKVYKMTNDTEKNKIILKRAQREYETLFRLTDMGCTPSAWHIQRNVIIMQCVGNQEPAPSITTLPSEHSKEMYDIFIQFLERWYCKFNLIHGRLSTKNILLYYIKRPFFMGWSHAVRRDHPKATKKLIRDCQFITEFFRSRDVPVKSTEKLYHEITGLHITRSDVQNAIQRPDLWKNWQITNPNREVTDRQTLSCYRNS